MNPNLKRLRMGLITVLLLLAIAGVLLLWRPWSVRYSTKKLRIDYTSGGTPLVLRGRVVDERGTPVVGRMILIKTSAGVSDVISDANGTFAVQSGEPSVSEIEVGQVGTAHWPDMFGTGIFELDIQRGVNLTITIKQHEKP